MKCGVFLVCCFCAYGAVEAAWPVVDTTSGRVRLAASVNLGVFPRFKVLFCLYAPYRFKESILTRRR